MIGVSVECFFALGKLNVMLGDAEQTTCYSIVEFFSSLAGNLRCPFLNWDPVGIPAPSKEAGASRTKTKVTDKQS